jgi:hypothetical protein
MQPITLVKIKWEITTDTPGMNPASNNPNKKRHATRPPKLLVAPWQIVTMPTSFKVSATLSRLNLAVHTPQAHNPT